MTALTEGYAVEYTRLYLVLRKLLIADACQKVYCLCLLHVNPARCHWITGRTFLGATLRFFRGLKGIGRGIKHSEYARSVLVVRVPLSRFIQQGHEFWETVSFGPGFMLTIRTQLLHY